MALVVTCGRHLCALLDTNDSCGRAEAQVIPPHSDDSREKFVRLQKVVGKIEVVGQSNLDPEVIKYSYFRFLDSTGAVITINEVTAENDCSSYIRPGVSGVFYFARLRECNFLYAIRTNGRFVNKTNVATGARTHLLMRGLLHLLIGIPFSFLIIGLPALAEGILLMIAYSKAPALPELQAYLTSDPSDVTSPAAA